MKKRAIRKAGRPKQTIAERDRHAAKRDLQRTDRLEREIAALAKRLQTQIAKTDHALEGLAARLMDRSDRLARSLSSGETREWAPGAADAPRAPKPEPVAAEGE